MGLFYILPASVHAADKVLETSPLEVMVVPNPDGIKQSPARRKMDSYQFNFGDPFGFGFPIPEFGDAPQRPQPMPEEKAPTEQPKKKRKTTRI